MFTEMDLKLSNQAPLIKIPFSNNAKSPVFATGPH